MASYWQAVGENLLLALDTLRTHKFRSFLTVLGVLIGTTTVILVASIITGLDTQLVQAAEQFGTRVVWVYKLQMGAPHKLSREERLRKPLTLEDAVAIKEQCPAVEDVSVAVFPKLLDFGLPPSTARYNGTRNEGAQYMGVDANYLSISNSSLADGRFLTATDDLHRRDVAVIASSVVEQLFQNEDPVGKQIVVDGHSFEVIGTLNKFKGFLGTARMIANFHPLPNLSRSLPRFEGPFHQRAREARTIEEAQDQIRSSAPPPACGRERSGQFWDLNRGLVRRSVPANHCVGGHRDDRHLLDRAAGRRHRGDGHHAGLGDRTHARNRRPQSGRGEAKGHCMAISAGGRGADRLGRPHRDRAGLGVELFDSTARARIPSTVPLWSVVAGFVVSTGVGLFFGIWPALKAAKLDPITALRYE